MLTLTGLKGTLVQYLQTFDPFNPECDEQPLSMSEQIIKYYDMELCWAGVHSPYGDSI